MLPLPSVKSIDRGAGAFGLSLNSPRSSQCSAHAMVNSVPSQGPPLRHAQVRMSPPSSTQQSTGFLVHLSACAGADSDSDPPSTTAATQRFADCSELPNPLCDPGSLDHCRVIAGSSLVDVGETLAIRGPAA